MKLPKTLPNSIKVLIILLGLSKKIIVDGIDIKSLKKSTFCFVLTGGNPAKNLSEDNLIGIEQRELNRPRN